MWDVDRDRTLPLPSINWVRWLIVPTAAFVALCLDRGYQTDFWQHLARGREIVRLGAVLRHNPFTFAAAGQPIRDANWLAQVIYARLFDLGAIELVQTVNAALVAIMLLVVVRMGRRACGSPACAALTGGMVFLGLWQVLLIRPQTFSLLLFVLLLDQLSRPRWRLLAIVPAMMALWANLHGGFAIGLLLIAAFAVASIIERAKAPTHEGVPSIWLYPLCLLTGLAATLLNPWGWEIYGAMMSVASRASGRGIEEWMPPGLGPWIGDAFLLWLAALVALSIRARRMPTILEICLAFCFIPLACRSVRMVPWLMLATDPMMASLIRDNLRQPSQETTARPSWLAACVVTTLCAATVLSLPWMEDRNPLMGRIRTAHRVESDLQKLEAGIPPTAKIFSRLEWGGYLDCMTGPSCRVYMDGWIELYPDDQWRQYLAISSAGKGWEKSLDRLSVDCLMLDGRYHGRLLLAVGQSGQWEVRGRSGAAVLLVRKSGAGDIAGSHY